MMFEMEKVLFIAPRFHTNQFYATKSLIENQVQVKFIARQSNKIENYEILKPSIIGDNAICRIMERITGGSPGKGIPPVFRLMRELRDFGPDIVVVREDESFSWISLLVCRLLDYDAVLYTQRKMVGQRYERRVTQLYHDHIQPMIYSLARCEITPLSGMNTDPVGRGGEGGVVCYDYILNNDSWIPGKGGFDDPPQRCADKPFSIRRSKLHSYRTYHVPLVIEWMGGDEKRFDEGDETRIMMVSEFQKRKRIIETLEILSVLIKEGKKVRLTIIGNAKRPHNRAHLEEVEDYVRRNGLESEVTIITDIPHQSVLEEYKKHDLFLLSSMREPAAYSVLEAMANGLLVISPSDNGTQEYIINGFNGFVFNTDDLSELKGILSSLCSDKKALATLGFNNEQVIKNLYTSDFYYRYLKHVWRDLQRTC